METPSPSGACRLVFERCSNFVTNDEFLFQLNYFFYNFLFIYLFILQLEVFARSFDLLSKNLGIKNR